MYNWINVRNPKSDPPPVWIVWVLVVVWLLPIILYAQHMNRLESKRKENDRKPFIQHRQGKYTLGNPSPGNNLGR